MDVSRGRCLLTPLLEERGWTQIELSRRTGYDLSKDPADRVGYSPRMISHFANWDGKGNGKLMSVEAMYVIARILDLPKMELLYEWIVK